MYVRILTLMLTGIVAVGVAHAQNPVGPAWEGAWYVVDSTDNNTGDRDVSAFQSYITGLDYVSLRMQCSDGKPTLAVEWSDQKFPDQTVVTFGASADADSDPTDRQYVFEQQKGAIDRWLRPPAETAAKIVAAIGDAGYVTVTAYPTSGKRSVGMDITGMPQAWARVSRHCPVRKMARPPM